MGMAQGMQTVVDEIKKGRTDRKNSEKSRIDNEKQRQDDEVPIAEDREKYVRSLISADKDRVKEAKQLLISRKKDVKHIFNEVNSFLSDVQDEMEETHRIWRSVSKAGRHFEGENGKAKATTKRSKSKKKKRK